MRPPPSWVALARGGMPPAAAASPSAAAAAGACASALFVRQPSLQSPLPTAFASPPAVCSAGAAPLFSACWQGTPLALASPLRSPGAPPVTRGLTFGAEQLSEAQGQPQQAEPLAGAASDVGAPLLGTEGLLAAAAMALEHQMRLHAQRLPVAADCAAAPTALAAPCAQGGGRAARRAGPAGGPTRRVLLLQPAGA